MAHTPEVQTPDVQSENCTHGRPTVLRSQVPVSMPGVLHTPEPQLPLAVQPTQVPIEHRFDVQSAF